MIYICIHPLRTTTDRRYDNDIHHFYTHIPHVPGQYGLNDLHVLLPTIYPRLEFWFWFRFWFFLWVLGLLVPERERKGACLVYVSDNV